MARRDEGTMLEPGNAEAALVAGKQESSLPDPLALARTLEVNP